MKKLLLLLLPALLLSCSSEETPKDPIVGSWRFDSYIEFPENSDPVLNEIDDCYKQETMTFTNQGEMHAVFYYVNNVMECHLNESATTTYEWSKVSENIYNLKLFSSNGRDIKFSFPDKNTLWMASGEPYEVDGVKYERTQYVYIRI